MERLGYRPLNNLIIAEQIFEEVKKEETTSKIEGLVLELSASDYDMLGKEKPAELLPTNKLQVHRVDDNYKDVKDGDVVVFNGKATRVRFGDKMYLVVRPTDLIAVKE